MKNHPSPELALSTCTAALLLACVLPNAQAQEHAAHQHNTATAEANKPTAAPLTTLKQTTVLGTALPTDVLHNPTSITVIDQSKSRMIPASSIANLLRDVPGVQISEQGIERVSIRGESSRRTAILIDGHKLTDHTNYGQPVLVDPTTIERIEIVRGSSSVVSGSQAIGGVINIVTKKGANKPLELTTSAGYFGSTQGYRVSASVAGKANNFDYRLSVGKADHNDRRSPTGRLKPSDTQDSTISAHLGYQVNKQHYFGIRAQQFKLAANVNIDPPMPNFYITLPNRDLQKWAVFYEGTRLTPWLVSLKADAYHQTVDRRFVNNAQVRRGPMLININSRSQDDQLTNGVKLVAEMNLIGQQRTAVGIEYEDDRLEADKMTVSTVTTPGPKPPTITHNPRYDKASIRTTSIFAQHEMDFSNTLTATAGSRYYRVNSELEASIHNGVHGPRNSNSDNLALGALGLVWSPSERLALRANLSQGYSYPTLSQLYHITTGGGTTINGNPNLQPERSTTFELGSRFEGESNSLDLTLFSTHAKDYITTVNDGQRQATYRNVNKANSYGLEIFADHRLDNFGLTPYITAALMRRKFEFANGTSTYDSGTPKLSGKIGLRKIWQHNDVSGEVDLFLRGESKVRQRFLENDQVSSASGYATLNLRADASLSKALYVSGELQNLTNKNYRSFGQMRGAKRSINLFISYRF